MNPKRLNIAKKKWFLQILLADNELYSCLNKDIKKLLGVHYLKSTRILESRGGLGNLIENYLSNRKIDILYEKYSAVDTIYTPKGTIKPYKILEKDAYIGQSKIPKYRQLSMKASQILPEDFMGELNTFIHRLEKQGLSEEEISQKTYLQINEMKKGFRQCQRDNWIDNVLKNIWRFYLG